MSVLPKPIRAAKMLTAPTLTVPTAVLAKGALPETGQLVKVLLFLTVSTLLIKIIFAVRVIQSFVVSFFLFIFRYRRVLYRFQFV